MRDLNTASNGEKSLDSRSWLCSPSSKSPATQPQVLCFSFSPRPLTTHHVELLSRGQSDVKGQPASRLRLAPCNIDRSDARYSEPIQSPKRSFRPDYFKKLYIHYDGGSDIYCDNSDFSDCSYVNDLSTSSARSRTSASARAEVNAMPFTTEHRQPRSRCTSPILESINEHVPSHLHNTFQAPGIDTFVDFDFSSITPPVATSVFPPGIERSYTTTSTNTTNRYQPSRQAPTTPSNDTQPRQMSFFIWDDDDDSEAEPHSQFARMNAMMKKSFADLRVSTRSRAGSIPPNQPKKSHQQKLSTSSVQTLAETRKTSTSSQGFTPQVLPTRTDKREAKSRSSSESKHFTRAPSSTFSSRSPGSESQSQHPIPPQHTLDPRHSVDDVHLNTNRTTKNSTSGVRTSPGSRPLTRSRVNSRPTSSTLSDPLTPLSPTSKRNEQKRRSTASASSASTPPAPQSPRKAISRLAGWVARKTKDEQ